MPRRLSVDRWNPSPPDPLAPDLRLDLDGPTLDALLATWLPVSRLAPLLAPLLAAEPSATVAHMTGLCARPAGTDGAMTIGMGVVTTSAGGTEERWSLSGRVVPALHVTPDGAVHLTVALDTDGGAAAWAVQTSRASWAGPTDLAELTASAAVRTRILRDRVLRQGASTLDLGPILTEVLGERVQEIRLTVQPGRVVVDARLFDAIDVGGSSVARARQDAHDQDPAWFGGGSVRLSTTGPDGAPLLVTGDALVQPATLVRGPGPGCATTTGTFEVELRDSADGSSHGQIRGSFQARSGLTVRGDRVVAGGPSLAWPHHLRLVDLRPAAAAADLAHLMTPLREAIWRTIARTRDLGAASAGAVGVTLLEGQGGRADAPTRFFVGSPRALPPRAAPERSDYPGFTAIFSEHALVASLVQAGLAPPSSSGPATWERTEHRFHVEHGGARAELELHDDGTQHLITHLPHGRGEVLRPQHAPLGIGPAVRLAGEHGVDLALFVDVARLGEGGLVVHGVARAWIDDRTAHGPVSPTPLGPQRVVGAIRDARRRPLVFRLEGGAHAEAGALIRRLQAGDSLPDVHVSRTGAGRPYLRGDPNGSRADNVAALPRPAFFERRTRQLAERDAGDDLLKKLAGAVAAPPIRLRPQPTRTSGPWDHGTACPSSPGRPPAHTWFNPAVAAPDPTGRARFGYSAAGERQEVVLQHGAVWWRPKDRVAHEPIAPPGRAPVARTYTRHRAGDDFPPPRFDLVVAAGNRVLAKQEGRFRFFFSTLAPEFLHADAPPAPCGGPRPRVARLARSLPDRVVLGGFAALDPEVGRNLSSAGAPLGPDDLDRMTWPVRADGNEHPSLAPFTVPDASGPALQRRLRPVVDQLVNLLVDLTKVLHMLPVGALAPLTFWLWVLTNLARPYLRQRAREAADRLVLAVEGRGGTSLARQTKELGVSPDILVAEVEPGFWYEVDPRTPYDADLRSEPPARFRWEAIAQWELPAESEDALKVRPVHGVKVHRVLDIGVGHVYRHLSWDESNGGEFDSMAGQGTVYYTTLLGPAEDGGGFVDGTTNFYVMVELEIAEGATADRLATLDQKRRTPPGMGLGDVLALVADEGAEDAIDVRARRLDQAQLLSDIVQTQSAPTASFRRTFAILWLDEQTYATDRFHVLHPTDAYWRIGKNWSLVGQADEWIRKVLGGRGDGFEETLRELITKHQILEELFPVDLTVDSNLETEHFWCPFASDWDGAGACIDGSSRMVVCRQVLLVTGHAPGQPDKKRLYSTNASYGTFDRSWRWRDWPAPAAPGEGWADLGVGVRDACLPSTLRARDDGTIVVQGRRGGVEGTWYQRVLAADGVEAPSGHALIAEARAGRGGRIPAFGFEHPWSFLPRESAGRPTWDDFDQHFDFGAPTTVDPRSQFYPVPSIGRSTIELGAMLDALRGDGIVGEDVRDALFWPAPLDIAGPRARRSPYNAHIRFNVRFRGHWGAIATFTDRREDELPALTTRMPALGRPGPAPGRLRLEHDSGWTDLTLGRRIRRWCKPVVQLADLTVDERNGALQVRFYSRMAGLRRRTRNLRWWEDSFGDPAFAWRDLCPANQPISDLDPALRADIEATLRAASGAPRAGWSDGVFPTAPPDDLPDFFIWRLRVGLLGDPASWVDLPVGELTDHQGVRFHATRHGHFLYALQRVDPVAAATLARHLRDDPTRVRVVFEDVAGNVATAERTRKTLA